MIDLESRPRRHGHDRIFWTGSAADGRDHAVTDDETARMVKRRDGTIVAVCGETVPVCTLDTPPMPECRACLTATLRANLPDIADRINPPKVARQHRHGRLHRHRGRAAHSEAA